MKHAWLYVSQADLKIEQEQFRDEGKDSARLLADFTRLGKADLENDPRAQQQAVELLDRAQRLSRIQGYAYREPSDLAGIRKERPAGPRRMRLKLSDASFLDRLHGAWLGRCAGCLLGKPVEGMRSTTMWPYLKDLGKDPLADFFRSDEPTRIMKKHQVGPNHSHVDKVKHMIEDDDTNYTATGLAILKQHGRGFTPTDVANFWMNNIPILHTCTAERVAYRNLSQLLPPPASASCRNVYREWIGAQIRADAFGYAAPGNPELAADFAWRDASISHIKNGIYGEMWVAAMLAAAAVTSDAEEVIRIGLSEVPAKSRLAEAIADVLAWKREGLGWEEAIARIHARWDEANPHHWCHTISNAQVVALGLLWSENDLGLGICRAVQACFDTDCNGATVGSILGMMLGARALPRRWTAPLRGRLATGVAGYHLVKIADLAGETLAVSKRILAER